MTPVEEEVRVRGGAVDRAAPRSATWCVEGRIDVARLLGDLAALHERLTGPRGPWGDGTPVDWRVLHRPTAPAAAPDWIGLLRDARRSAGPAVLWLVTGPPERAQVAVATSAGCPGPDWLVAATERGDGGHPPASAPGEGRRPVAWRTPPLRFPGAVRHRPLAGIRTASPVVAGPAPAGERDEAFSRLVAAVAVVGWRVSGLRRFGLQWLQDDDGRELELIVDDVPVGELLAACRALVADPAPAAGLLPGGVAVVDRRSPVAIPLAGARLVPSGTAPRLQAPEVEVALAEAGGREVVTIAADPSEFPDDVQRALGASILAAADALADPTAATTAVDRLGLLPQAALGPAVAAVRGPALGPAPARTIPGRIATVAAAHPDAVAIVDGPVAVRYGELWERSTELARSIGAAAPGPRVALVLDRSAEFVVGALATLIAGRAYVPLDPTWPRRRIDDILARVGPAAVVSRPARGVPLAVEPLPSADAAPPGPATEDAPAYVIMTSGSTGVPKGVVVRHGSVVDLVDGCCQELGLGRADVWSQYHSTAFDFSVWEIFGALLCGGATAVVPDEARLDAAALFACLRAAGVSVLSLTPSAFAGLFESCAALGPVPERLRLVTFGGEELDPATLGPWAATYGLVRPRLVNMYGITETTVHVTAHVVDQAFLTAGRSRIGRPLPGYELHVTDPQGRPVPNLVRGELLVGGVGVSAGYLGAPDLTAERFVLRAPGGEEPQRLYRSGDVGRRWPDGTVEYLGRQDDQVSVRGHRVEPGEVESALRRCEGVRDAVALLVPVTHGPVPQLAAVVAASDSYDEAAVRARVAQVLPSHCVPQRLVPVDALPRTPNGKVDRDALRSLLATATGPGGEGSGDRVPGAATWPATGRVVEEVWTELLGSRPGERSFLDAGGDSLVAARMVARCRARGVVVRVADVYGAAAGADLVAQAVPGPTRPRRPLGTGALPASGTHRAPQDRLDALVTGSGIPGAAVALLVGDDLWVSASGVASIVTGRRVTAGTRFPIGSVAKVLAATHLVQLAAQGRCTLDDRVVDHVPELPRVDPRVEALRLRHLLTHTAGLREAADPPLGRGEDAVARLVAGLDGRLLCAPGACYSYAGSGFAVLARAVETMLGEPWDQTVGSTLLRPLGLADIALLTGDGTGDGRGITIAAGHVDHGDRVEALPPLTARGLMASGPGVYASVVDLVRFARLFFTGGRRPVEEQVLPAEWPRRMQEPLVDIPSGYLAGARQGLGWAVATWMGPTLLFHDGDVPGAGASLIVVPSRNVAVATASNAPDGGDALAPLVRDLLVGAGIPFRPEPPLPVAPAGDAAAGAPAALAGRYGGSHTDYEVRPDGTDGVHITERRAGGLPPAHRSYCPLGGGYFTARHGPRRIVWFVDVAGGPALHIGGRLATKTTGGEP